MNVGGLLDEWPSESDLPALKDRVLKEPAFVGRVVGREGRHSAIMLRTNFMGEADSARVHAEVKRIAARHESDGFKLYVAGLPALAADLTHLMLSDLGRMGSVGLLLMIVMMEIFHIK